jgi:hypothetical protein
MILTQKPTTEDDRDSLHIGFSQLHVATLNRKFRWSCGDDHLVTQSLQNRFKPYFHDWSWCWRRLARGTARVSDPHIFDAQCIVHFFPSKHKRCSCVWFFHVPLQHLLVNSGDCMAWRSTQSNKTKNQAPTMTLPKSHMHLVSRGSTTG